MRTSTSLAIVALGALCAISARPAQSDGWIPLFDGRSLAGWKAAENPATFRVENGEIVVRGPRAHLFYDGPVMNHSFRDFELRLEVLTKPGANSGVYLRTAYQPTDWPAHGYEVQVNNSHTDWRRTGSLYGVQDTRDARRDDTWVAMHAIVRGRRIRVLVDGRQVVDYTEPADSATRLTGGTIALQGHDPESEVHYRNIMIRPLSTPSENPR